MIVNMFCSMFLPVCRNSDITCGNNSKVCRKKWNIFVKQVCGDSVLCVVRITLRKTG